MDTKSATPELSRCRVKPVSAWGPVVLLMAAIYIGSAQPHIALPFATTLTDKLIHAIIYFALALLAYRAARLVPLSVRGGPYLQALAVSAIYGASDEYHQLFVPGRSAEILDWLADALGALLALVVIALVHKRVATNGGRSVDGGRQRLRGNRQAKSETGRGSKRAG